MAIAPRVLNRHHTIASSTAIYVGRPTRWGNPFKIGKDGTREEVVEKYRHWICDSPEASHLRNTISELRGVDLVCWCAPQACHADVLLELANGASR